MALKRNIALMGISTVTRLAAGLFTFSVLARLLGPESFGVLMLWLSVAVLISLLANYGLTTYVLREIGAKPQDTEVLMNEAFTGKLLISLLLFVLSGFAAFGLNLDHKVVFLCLLIGAITDTFIEFLSAGFRARDKFAVETRIASITAFTHAAIVCTAVFFSATVETAAVAYTSSRLTVLLITSVSVAREFAPVRLVSIRRAFHRMRAAVTYAADFAFQSLFGQIDSVVLNHFLGPVAVGLYQAGMRVFQGGVAAAQVLANVFLPRAAARSENVEAFAKESNRIQFAFLGVGTLFGVALALLAKPIVDILFGAAYKELIGLFPLFGMLFFVRFSAAAWGVVLTAAGEQKYRTFATICHWVLIASVAPFWVSVLGVGGWLASLITGNIFLAFMYAFRGAKRVRSPWVTICITVLCSIAFVPFIHIQL